MNQQNKPFKQVTAYTDQTPVLASNSSQILEENKPQDNQKVEELDFPSYCCKILSEIGWKGFSSELIQEFSGKAMDYQSRITELEAELRSIKDTIEKDPVSFILVHALKYLNNDDKIVLLEKLGRRTNLTELAEQALKDNG